MGEFETKLLIKLGNVLLAAAYTLGALIVLFPIQQTAIPKEFGYISVGLLLLVTGIFGSPYFVER